MSTFTVPNPVGKAVMLSVRHLDVRLSGKQVLDDVSFTWMGGILGVAGANGSGKSTLLAAIAGFVRPSSGRVEVGDGSGRGAVPARIGYLPQSFDYPRALRIDDFVRYASWLRSGSRPSAARAAEALDAVGLADAAGVRLGHASGGMVRRAGLAAVLVDSPQLLLLDEPTTGVDAEQRVVMRELIREQAASRSVIMSSHISEDLEELCDQFLLLGDGRARFFGSTEEARRLAGGSTLEEAIVAIPKRSGGR